MALPRRTHEARIAPVPAERVGVTGAEPHSGPDVVPAPVDLLRRVLDGLRRNS